VLVEEKEEVVCSSLRRCMRWIFLRSSNTRSRGGAVPGGWGGGHLYVNQNMAHGSSPGEGGRYGLLYSLENYNIVPEIALGLGGAQFLGR
jgi:hypothetical protein